MDERGAALRLDLSPQVPDVDVDDVAFAVELEPPHVFGDHPTGQDAPDVAKKVLEYSLAVRWMARSPRVTVRVEGSRDRSATRSTGVLWGPPRRSRARTRARNS
jgi:hypothetical protein